MTTAYYIMRMGPALTLKHVSGALTQNVLEIIRQAIMRKTLADYTLQLDRWKRMLTDMYQRTTHKESRQYLNFSCCCNIDNREYEILPYLDFYNITLQILYQLLQLINVCSNSLHEQHSLVMSLKERFVARPTKCKLQSCNLYTISTKLVIKLQFHYCSQLVFISLFIKTLSDADHLEIQEKFTYQLLKYLEILDPGRTWTKDKLVKNLQGIMIKKGYGVRVHQSITNLTCQLQFVRLSSQLWMKVFSCPYGK